MRPGQRRTAGINFIGLRSVRGIAQQRFNPANWTHTSLHPNERGHTAMLRVFQAWLAENPFLDAPRMPISASAKAGARNGLTALRLTTDTQMEQAALRAAPPCDLFDASHRGCRLQGQRWAYQEIGKVLLHDGLFALAAVAAGGVWCAAIALFTWRRRVWARRGSPITG